MKLDRAATILLCLVFTVACGPSAAASRGPLRETPDSMVSGAAVSTEAVVGEPQMVYHVAIDGSDANPGTAEAPFASLQHARDVVRGVNAAMTGPITVYIHSGTHFLSEPIAFGEADSGQNGFEITYRAAEGEMPVFSGGVSVTGWNPVPASSLWKAVLGDVSGFRQMYVNGTRARRAASEEAVTGLRFVEGSVSPRDGIQMAPGVLPDLARPADLELHWIYDWKDMRLLARDIDVNADGSKTIWMRQPELANALVMATWNNNTHYWYPKPEVPFYLENAFELLDRPGEWYFNAATSELFYMPRPGEDLLTAEVIIPQTETLLRVAGRAGPHDVHDLVFDGLAFRYAGWTRPSEEGAIANQAQHHLGINGGAEYMTPGHVEVGFARDVRFTRCRFEHLGGLGLYLGSNTTKVRVEGSLFQDISDGAIAVGHFDHAYIEPNSPTRPASNNLIANNLVHSVGVEYWGAAAITAYYANGLSVRHNEISDSANSGIAVGWGWAENPDSTTSHDNVVESNLLTDLSQRSRDAGGVYMLGQQPASKVERNVIRRMKNDYACLYPDAGSAFIAFRDNVCDSAPYWLHLHTQSIHDINISNTYTNSGYSANRGTDIVVSGTVFVNGQDWPPEAKAIIESAGLEPPYEYLHEWLGTS